MAQRSHPQTPFELLDPECFKPPAPATGFRAIKSIGTESWNSEQWDLQTNRYPQTVLLIKFREIGWMQDSKTRPSKSTPEQVRPHFTRSFKVNVLA